MSANNRVKAFVRIRPTSKFAHESIELPSDGTSITIRAEKDKKRGYINNQILDWSFRTDKVLHNASQEEVYTHVGKDIVSRVLLGYNGTIMAYGQTGAGKTFTMTGSTEKFIHRGIIPRAITQLFREINERRDFSTTVRISYLEIYNEFMFDLLGTLPNVRPVHPSQMSVTEGQNGRTQVKGLSVHFANTEEEALNLLFEGESNRIIAAHSLNRFSSRSHCIFTMYVESRSRIESRATYTISKLNLVDLAGSERLSKTNSTGETEREAMYINKSLTFLEQVVVALSEKRDHIPYRQSKLTHVLKDSIGGTSCTALVANIWGEASQLEETTCTLRFLTRMRSISCEPTVEENYDPMIVCKNYEKEIRILRQELAKHDMLTNRGQITYEQLSEAQIEEIRSHVNRYLSGDIEELELINLRQIKEIFNQFKIILVNMESTVEEKLKEKYLLQERSTATAGGRPDTGAKSSATVGGESPQVGDSDGQGFGVGVAPQNVKANIGALVSSRKTKSRKGKDRNGSADGKPGSPAAGAGGSPTLPPDGQDGRPMSPASTVPGLQHTPAPPDSAPPPKSEAFEQFKQELGSELNRILHENKEILKEKKKAAHKLSQSINELKKEIDESKVKLEEKQLQRQEIDGVQESEKEIIDEEEYELLHRYKDMKMKYRTNFEELADVKSQIIYCEKLVNQCRQRLVAEFDSWYSESFLAGEASRVSPSPGGQRASAGRIPGEPEDEQEKFDRLQLELLMEHPDSVPYYNARMQTERRTHYTSAGQNKRKPGDVIPTIRNKPPTALIVK